MKSNYIVGPLCFWLFFLTQLSHSQLSAQENWPQFRGVEASGIGSGSPPTEWNTETGDNIVWKTPIPGLAHSAPIVWGDRVFLTTCVNANAKQTDLPTGWIGGTGKSAEDVGDWTWQVICLDRKNGKVVWSKDVAKGKPEVKRHRKATHANCTPATDGKHVVAFFGSEGLFCLDFDGNLIWEKSFGRLHSGPYNSKDLEWGFASSPIIFEGNVVVQCDCLNTGFVSILEIESGDEVRRIDREDVATWSTPAVFRTETGTQLVCNGYKQMAGYDFETGKQLWTLSNGGDVPVPTPLFSNGMIFLTNGHGRSPTYAINPSATGDLTPNKESESLPPGLAWWQPKDGSYMPTPIVVGDLLYTCSDNGRLAVREAVTGELVYKQRVTNGSNTFSASAVATSAQVYFSSENGDVIVVKAGRKYELIAKNQMRETLMSTPAIAGDQLFVRTIEHLYCIETTDKKK